MTETVLGTGGVHGDRARALREHRAARAYCGCVTRRTVTLLTGLALVVVLGALGSAVRVPFVALGPGPTYNTLADVGGTPVVDIEGTQTYPTAGNLNMTTVSVRDGITLFGAVGLWLSGRDALVPRETVYPADRSTQQIEQQNTADFQQSESSAVVAALGYLKYPFTIKVAQLADASPAAGVLQAGDQITSVDGTAITSTTGVRDALAASAPGQRVQLGYTRGGTAATGSVVLGTFPDGQTQGFLGVTTSAEPDVPFTVKISLQDVGGPSAGLMFALGVVDKLTTGELNNGAFVAGTGTIDSVGTVGPIGGIPFKLVAAREAGASTFLVPAQNCAEALANAPDGLRLVKVDTLADAVGDLDSLAAGADVPSC
jgi:PDZ domain-containing protein